MKHSIRIGLVMSYGLNFYRDILRGIKAFAETRPHWVFTPIAPSRVPCARCARSTNTG